MTPTQEYPLFLAQAGKLADRRQAVTSTYLTVNAAIFGVIAFVMKDVQMVDWGKRISVLLLLLTGFIICGLWRRLIIRYSQLLKWWFAQLRALEEKLPDSSRLLTEEYTNLYRNDHIGIATYEDRLITIFQMMYVAATLGMAGVWFLN
jgi:hypothetical protein